jgi:hypothetical protein
LQILFGAILGDDVVDCLHEKKSENLMLLLVFFINNVKYLLKIEQNP